MKRNFDSPLIGLDGAAIKDGPPKFKMKGDKVELDEATGDPIILEQANDCTLRLVAINAIGAQLRGDESMSGEEKFKLYALAQKINGGGVVEVDEKDIGVLKDRIAKAYPVMVVGAAWSILNADYTEAAAA